MRSSSIFAAVALAASAQAAVTTTLPASKGAVATNVAIAVKGSFDGGMKKYDRSRECTPSQMVISEHNTDLIGNSRGV